MTAIRRGIRRTLPLLIALAACLVFAPPALAAEYTLEVSEALDGTGFGEVACEFKVEGFTEVEQPCEELFFESKKLIKLIPVPELGSEFVRFQNGTGSAAACNGMTKTCSFTLEADSYVEAKFDEIKPSLAIKTSGGGEVECAIESGLPELCESEYPFETEVTLVPEPESGWEFSSFKNGTGSASKCSGLTSSCSVLLEKDSTLEAVFVPAMRSLALKKAGTGSGTVTSEPTGINCGSTCTAKFAEGTEVKLKAVAAAGSTFAGWSGEGCSGTGSCVVTLEKGEASVTATFTPLKRKLIVSTAGSGTGTVTSVPSGINCGSVCSAEYDNGTEVTLTGIQDAGAEAVQWSGCTSITGEGKCKVTMSSAKTVTATFDLVKHPLTITKAGTGSGTVTCNGTTCAPSYSEGTKVTLEATPASGSTFAGWSGEGCSGTGSCVVTIGEAAAAVTATFTASSKPPPEGPQAGKATVGAVAKVKGGRARVRLSCSGGLCKGAVKLSAKLRRGAGSVVIGRTPFTLASGESTVLLVKLSTAAKGQLQKRGTLRAKAAGTGVVARSLKLKLAR